MEYAAQASVPEEPAAPAAATEVAVPEHTQEDNVVVFVDTEERSNEAVIDVTKEDMPFESEFAAATEACVGDFRILPDEAFRDIHLMFAHGDLEAHAMGRPWVTTHSTMGNQTASCLQACIGDFRILPDEAFRDIHLMFAHGDLEVRAMGNHMASCLPACNGDFRLLPDEAFRDIHLGRQAEPEMQDACCWSLKPSVASWRLPLPLKGVAVAEMVSTEDDEEIEEVPRIPALPPMESIIWLELKKGVLECNPDALEVFQSGVGFVNPIMISGKLRTGKSYLMNALSDSQAFGVSAQARSFTQGVHICNRLAPCTMFGGPEDGPSLAFVDAEGQADKGKSYDIKLATPLLLVSKVIIMNEICPIGPSKEDILRTIEIFMRAAEQVSERKKRKKLFGNLHLIMRDCSQPDAECWDIIFESEDPDIAETDEQAQAIVERNKIREGIFNAFESVPKVWCLPKLLTNYVPKNYRDNSPEYVAKIEEMRAFMGKQLAEPKLLDDKPLTGTMIAALMPQLQEALKSDSPILNPPSMMQAVCDLEAQRIVEKFGVEVDRFFRIDMTNKLPLASPYYEGEMDCAKALLTKELKEKLDYLPTESQVKVFPQFEQRLGLMDDRLAALNREKLAAEALQGALDRGNSLELQIQAERLRGEEARSEIDNLLSQRESERNRADMLMAQIEESNIARQQERDRIAELEELLNKEVSEREADLQKEIEEQKIASEQAEVTRVEEAERVEQEKLEQDTLMEQQRLEMEEMQKQMDEERKAREEAEAELGEREELIEEEDEAAKQIEKAAETKKEIPLILAVKDADLKAVRGLIRRHPDSLFLKDKNLRSALHFVEDLDVCKALLKGKADPNAQDMGLWTPLHNSVSRGSVGVSESIMNANGNVLLTTLGGNTALDLAYARPDVTVMLLSQLPELYNTLEPEDRLQPSQAGPPDPPNAQSTQSAISDANQPIMAADDEVDVDSASGAVVDAVPAAGSADGEAGGLKVEDDKDQEDEGGEDVLELVDDDEDEDEDVDVEPTEEDDEREEQPAGRGGIEENKQHEQEPS